MARCRFNGCALKNGHRGSHQSRRALNNPWEFEPDEYTPETFPYGQRSYSVPAKKNRARRNSSARQNMAIPPRYFSEMMKSKRAIKTRGQQWETFMGMDDDQLVAVIKHRPNADKENAFFELLRRAAGAIVRGGELVPGQKSRPGEGGERYLVDRTPKYRKALAFIVFDDEMPLVYQEKAALALDRLGVDPYELVLKQGRSRKASLTADDLDAFIMARSTAGKAKENRARTNSGRARRNSLNSATKAHLRTLSDYQLEKISKLGDEFGEYAYEARRILRGR